MWVTETTVNEKVTNWPKQTLLKMNYSSAQPACNYGNKYLQIAMRMRFWYA